jgi:hypothetical protein
VDASMERPLCERSNDTIARCQATGIRRGPMHRVHEEMRAVSLRAGSLQIEARRLNRDVAAVA